MNLMLETLKAIFFGVVEGITEWLPISSTGHLILLNEFVQMQMSDAFMSMFKVVIQLGAILAVVVLYFGKLWPFRRAQKGEGITGFLKMDIVNLWIRIVVAILPSAIVGIPLDDWMEAHLHTAPVVAAMLVLYGVAFIVVERRQNDRRRPRVQSAELIDMRMALLIGMFQVLSLVPGTSRSGATILGGLLFGASRTVAAEFTFFLAIPVMFGASALKMVKFGFHYTGAEILILVVGMVTAFIVSVLSIKFLMRYIKTNDFKAFGWYRIVLGIIVLIYLFMVGDPTAND